MPDLAMRLGGLKLTSPIVCGSGEHVASRDGLVAAIDAGAAAVVGKSANETEAGRRQWAAARSTHVGDSLFNRSGLVPAPWEDWLETLAGADAHARERGAYVVASVIPGNAAALPGLAADVEAAGLRWLELNLSAPHAGEARPGAIERTADAARTRELTAAVRAAVSIPVTVKLSGESADVVAMAAAAREAGADSVAMIGRHMGFVPDPDTRRPVLGSFGAIGGPWGLPLALRWVAKTRLALGPELPIVGTNGARSGRDVARFLLAGASAVQLATSVIDEGFGALARVRAELERYLAERGADARDLVGEAADAALTYEEAAVQETTSA
jgi:dihydroorotate dehydrogenase (NAD+) catalytic subunit